jgi:hypothetical protein
MPEQVEYIREVFHLSPKKSTERASRRPQIVHDVVHKRAKLTAYNLQLEQKL